jgi:outer membrane protein assembly factor BamB
VVAGKSLLDQYGNTICTIDADFEDGFPSVADLDADGLGEFLIVGNGAVRIFEHDCSFKTDWPLAGGGNGGPPTIGDFDGDTEPEVGIAGATVYSVYETDGTLLWSQPVTDTSSHATGSSVFDFDGDGQAEVVYADEVSLWVYDGKTGEVRLQDTLHTSRTLHEYPVIADVDADGHAEIIIPNGGGHHGSQLGGLYVLGSADESWRSNRQVWNQHAYSITNINDDLSIPSPAVANWPTWNSFRSGDVDPISGTRMVDARPVLADICARECRQGVIGIAYQVGNHGLADMRSAVPISVYAVDGDERILIETEWTTQTTDAGWSSDGFVLRLQRDQLPEGVIEIVADDDGTGNGVVTECHEDNNAREYDLSEVCARFDD